MQGGSHLQDQCSTCCYSLSLYFVKKNMHMEKDVVLVPWPRYFSFKVSYLCRASLMFLNLPLEDTKSWSFSIVCLVFKKTSSLIKYVEIIHILEIIIRFQKNDNICYHICIFWNIHILLVQICTSIFTRVYS